MQDADVATRLTRVTRIRDWIAHRRGTLIALAVLVVAVLGFAAIHKLTAEIRVSVVRAAFAALGWPDLSASIALTVVSAIDRQATVITPAQNVTPAIRTTRATAASSRPARL